ncbi:hypothetical protein DI272_28290 [Streptomyces sp. Act143]|uniref:hypothetical protein n=1 Tax=Streptomyces sp. Act143 TaxID=2200760 RepID=UPI000D68336F|nr:hypothetical protein [Streptomyces sp. Act143]PWI17631.1 hypothetical protein DI272_28290 [Streptomyces sp. Act143]
MADKQYEWLNRELAERLLRGESLDNAVEPTARDEAERLAKTLGALSVNPAPNAAELPGEEAALAAFRKAHAERGTGTVRAGRTARADHGDPAAAHADVGLVRIGGRHGRTTARPAAGSRRSRPVRLALAAALAFGMAGGVAAAAGAGLLPPPFGDDRPGPNASVSAAATSDRPLVSPSPDGTGAGEPSPGGSDAGSADTGGGRDTARGGASSSPGAGKDDKDGKSGSWWNTAPSACRDMRDGKELSTDRRRALERLAGGSTRVWKFCQGVLDSSSGTGSAGTGSGSQPGQGEDRDGGKDQDGNGGKGGGGKGGDEDGHHRGRGGGDHRGGGNRHDADGGSSAAEPDTAAPLLPKKATTSPAPAPSPSYSAL